MNQPAADRADKVTGSVNGLSMNVSIHWNCAGILLSPKSISCKQSYSCIATYGKGRLYPK